MKAFDKANLKRPEFTVEQGGVTATIYREIFMSVRGDAEQEIASYLGISRRQLHRIRETESAADASESK